MKNEKSQVDFHILYIFGIFGDILNLLRKFKF